MKQPTTKKWFGILFLITLFFVLTVFSASAETEGIFTYTVVNGEATITEVDYQDVTDLVIPETLGDVPVTAIGDSFLKDNDNTRGNGGNTVFIPKTVTAISSKAFFASDVRQILVDADNPNYVAADGVLFSKDMKTLLAVPGAYTAESYSVPEDVESIGIYAFHTCILIEEVIFPSSLRSIGEQAFFHAMNIKRLQMNEGLTAIGANCFAWCYGLEDVTIPSTLSKITGSAFTECNALETIVIPEGVSVIEYFAFESCPMLKHVYLPKTLTVIGTGAFGNSNALTDICYAGTQEEWENLTIDTNAYHGSRPVVIDACTIHYNTPVEAYLNLDYENDNDILTFSGTGYIPGGWHYWDADKDSVTTVLVNGDVASIAAGAFSEYPALTTVILNTDTTSVANGAFTACPNLQAVLCFGSSSFGTAAFDFDGVCKVYENNDAAHSLSASQGDLAVIPYRFSDGTLQLLADVSFDSYEFFDTMAAFTLKYDNIQKLSFQRFTFDSIPMYYYPDEDSAAVRIEDNTLVNGEIYPLIYVDGTATAITFNELVSGLADKSITGFSLIATDENHKQIKDTPITITDNDENDDESGFIGAIRKAMRWVITLLNKLFKILGKK